MTTIAQDPKQVDMTTGSYIRRVEWDTMKIGKFNLTPSDGWRDWASTDVKVNCVYPNTAKVYVDFRTLSHEIITINLTRP